MAHDHIPADGTHITAVIGIVPVVAHDKVFAVRHLIGAEFVPAADAVLIVDVGFLIPDLFGLALFLYIQITVFQPDRISG